MERMKKPKLFTMKVDEDELSRWKFFAQNRQMHLSDDIKKLMRGEKLPDVVPPKKRPKRKYSDVNPELIVAINRIGGNLNQITKRVNDRRAWENQKVDVVMQLSVIEQQLERLLDAHKIS